MWVFRIEQWEKCDIYCYVVVYTYRKKYLLAQIFISSPFTTSHCISSLRKIRLLQAEHWYISSENVYTLALCSLIDNWWLKLRFNRNLRKYTHTLKLIVTTLLWFKVINAISSENIKSILEAISYFFLASSLLWGQKNHFTFIVSMQHVVQYLCYLHLEYLIPCSRILMTVNV